MKIIKFIIPSLLLFMPIGVFAEGCEDYTETDCPSAADSGCYWMPEDPILEEPGGCRQCLDGDYSIGTECKSCLAGDK